MSKIYNNILEAVSSNKKLLTILVDPDKIAAEKLPSLLKRVNATTITHVFVGGSTVDEDIIEDFVKTIKEHTNLPVVIFPGDVTQISETSDALLFLSLISGRNPDYLIDKQIQAVSKLKDTSLEVIPTGYILIENGKETSVERISKTKPMSRNNIQLISDTAKAGELLGMKLIYLEAGSGAQRPINSEIISEVKNNLNIPLIVGGGIKNKQQLENAYNAGANMVVIGNAFEENNTLFKELI